MSQIVVEVQEVQQQRLLTYISTPSSDARQKPIIQTIHTAMCGLKGNRASRSRVFQMLTSRCPESASSDSHR